MDAASLREHVIHLANQCDDVNLLIRVVHLLEGGEVPRQASYSINDDGHLTESADFSTRRDTTQYDLSAEDPLAHDGARPSQFLFEPLKFDFGGAEIPSGNNAADLSSQTTGAPVNVPASAAATTDDADTSDPLSKSGDGARHRHHVTIATGNSPNQPHQPAANDSGHDSDGGGGHNRSTRRRIAVSAIPVNMQKVAEFVPRIVAKSPEEAETVRKGVTESHLFASMDEDEQEVIVKAMEKKTFDSGAVILEEGKPPTGYFYMVVAGTCEVTKQGKYIATLTPGATFGELEMIYNIPQCSASITTVTACTMWCLDQESYQNIVLKVTIRKRERFQEALSHVSFLESISDYDKMTLADALVGESFDEGQHLIRFAEKGRYMHIILEGTVQVIGRDKGQKVEIVRLGKGDVVGELEFLFGHLAVADVIAVGKVKTATITKEHFERCMGPVVDELKRFVAMKGNYTHYLKEADDEVKKQINNLGRRVKRTADAAGAVEMLTNIDDSGEIVLVDRRDGGALPSTSGRSVTLFRYPLFPLQQGNALLLVGLRENGTIASWNDAMEHVTNYRAAEAIGRSFYSFLLSESDQRKLHDAVQNAIKYAGNIEGFKADASGKEKAVFTFQRSDGLTRSQLQFTIVPPSVAHKNVSEMLLAVGTEIRKPPPPRHTDATKWLVENIKKELQRPSIASGSSGGDSLLVPDAQASSGDAQLPSSVDDQEQQRRANIASILAQFEARSEVVAAQSTDNLRVVNVRQLIGQIIMDYSAAVVERGHSVIQNFDDLYVDEVYCDAKLLPECLKYALSNCVNHLRNATITIVVSMAEEFGAEMLQIEFIDDGVGIPPKLLAIFNDRSGAEREVPMTRVRKAVEMQGGSMRIDSIQGEGTTVTFRVPFIPHEDMGASQMDAGLSESGAGSASSASFNRKQQTFTTLVVEESAVHRNMLCALLWERKHAVLPGYSFADIQRLREVADVLIIDPQQSVLTSAAAQVDPFSFLRELAKEVTVVITSEGFVDATRDAYHAAGFLTLNKPCTAMQAMTALRKAEEMSAKLKANLQAVAALRDTFNNGVQNRGEWRKGKLLGKGSFGEVYEAIDVLTGGKMAVKIMRVTRSMNKEEVIHEIEVMRTLQHPNIIHYFYAQDNETDNTITVFMEYAGGGTLQGLLNSKGKLEFSEFVRILREIVDGVAYVHQMRFVHCDLKTANVLLTAESKCKIGDFGTAKQLLRDTDKLFVMNGTPLYMAPEVMSADPDEKIGYSFPADIWSLGCIALEMSTCKAPFSHLKEIQGPMGLMKYVTELQDVPDLSPLFDMPPSVIEFVSACLQPDPSKRPLASQLKTFSLFSDEGDANLKDALKAMKRAQLLHVLNRFVAFQDPEELEEQRKEQERFHTQRNDSGFFDSSDDDDDGGDDDADGQSSGGNDDVDAGGGKKPKPKPKRSKDAEAAFFASSSEEDDDDGDSGDEKDKKMPTKESRGNQSHISNHSAVSSHAGIGSNGPSMHRPIFEITKGAHAPVIRHGTQHPSPGNGSSTPQIVRSPTTRSPQAMPLQPLTPHPPDAEKLHAARPTVQQQQLVPPPQPLPSTTTTSAASALRNIPWEISVDERRQTKVGGSSLGSGTTSSEGGVVTLLEVAAPVPLVGNALASTSSTSSVSGGNVLSATDVTGTNGITATEMSAVLLHDALLSLLDALRLPVDDERNGLVQQYRERLRRGVGDSTNTVVAVAAAAAADTAAPTAFRFDCNRLLVSDAELINEMAKHMRQGPPRLA